MQCRLLKRSICDANAKNEDDHDGDVDIDD